MFNKDYFNKDYFTGMLNTLLTPAQQAAKNDSRLHNCAAYYASKGLTIPLKDPKELMDKFAEFKGLVRRGSMTIEQIENMVARKYGIIDKDTEEIDSFNDQVEFQEGSAAE